MMVLRVKTMHVEKDIKPNKVHLTQGRRSDVAEHRTRPTDPNFSQGLTPPRKRPPEFQGYDDRQTQPQTLNDLFPVTAFSLWCLWTENLRRKGKRSSFFSDLVLGTLGPLPPEGLCAPCTGNRKREWGRSVCTGSPCLPERTPVPTQPRPGSPLSG